MDISMRDGEAEHKEKQHVFIIGCKGIPAKYGGFESFVENLTYHKKSQEIQYHVFCLENSTEFNPSSRSFMHNGADCYNIKALNIGSAKAIFYDLEAFKQCIAYIERERIGNPIVYVLACRIGPFIGYFKKKLVRLGGSLYVNPDGHEWMRGKWSMPIQEYWKLSEKLTVKHADLLICDSKKIEKYMKETYQKYCPNTTFIPYGAEVHESSSLPNNAPLLLDWYSQHSLSPYNYFLIVGRFVPENNYAIIIREFMISKSTKSLVIVTGMNKSLLNRIKTATGFEKDSRIKFVGTVYDQELLKLIRIGAYGYIHGHEVGGTNPSLLESLGATRLNLLLDIGFNSEVGEDGAVYWTKENGNLAALIEMVEEMGTEEIEKIGNRAKQRIKDGYSWDYVIKKYEDRFLNYKKSYQALL